MENAQDRYARHARELAIAGPIAIAMGVFLFPEPGDPRYLTWAFRWSVLIALGLACCGTAVWYWLRARKAGSDTNPRYEFKRRNSSLAMAGQTPGPASFGKARPAAKPSENHHNSDPIAFIERANAESDTPTKLGFENVGRATVFSPKLGAVINVGGWAMESGGAYSINCWTHPGFAGQAKCPSVSSDEYRGVVRNDTGWFTPIARTEDSQTFLLKPFIFKNYSGEVEKLHFTDGQSYTCEELLVDVVPLLLTLDVWKVEESGGRKVIFAIPDGLRRAV